MNSFWTGSGSKLNDDGCGVTDLKVTFRVESTFSEFDKLSPDRGPLNYAGTVERWSRPLSVNVVVTASAAKPLSCGPMVTWSVRQSVKDSGSDP